MRSALILTLVVVAALLAVPLSSATVIHATINTKTNEGYVNATSNYVLYYNYPNNSSTSKALNGTVIWFNATSYLNSTGKMQLGGDMNEYKDQQGNDQAHAMDAATSENTTTNSTTNTTTNSTHLPVMHVVNATLKYQMHAFASATNLTVYRNLTIDLKISNITKKVGNNTTIIDMSWRAFGVQGKLMSDFRGQLQMVNPNMGLNFQYYVNTNMDVNQLGNFGSFGGIGNDQGNFELGSFFEDGGFGANVMNYNTINFKVFSVPLNQWARQYNSATNSTTFYYNASSNYSLNSSMSVNGQNYSIKLMTDPSAAITTNGYASVNSANELAVSNASPPPVLSLGIEAAIGVGIVALIAIGLVALRLRQKSIKK